MPSEWTFAGVPVGTAGSLPQQPHLQSLRWNSNSSGGALKQVSCASRKKVLQELYEPVILKNAVQDVIVAKIALSLACRLAVATGLWIFPSDDGQYCHGGAYKRLDVD